LAGLKPWGIWKPPLSEEQVAAAAIVFGEKFCSQVTDYSDLENDPYMLWFQRITRTACKEPKF
jgi:hypothetical protein